MAHQGDVLASLVSQEWGATPKTILDVSAGIGTQAIPLAQHGHRVVAGDISRKSVARAKHEAIPRGVTLNVFAADMSSLPVKDESADVVMACDNSLPHLLTEEAVRGALREFYRCVRRGGGCLVTMRDYGPCPPSGTQERRPYGTRVIDGKPHEVRQTWTWVGSHYKLLFEIIDEETGAAVVSAETTYFAIPISRVMELMLTVGFSEVHRVDDVFFQPVLLGTTQLAA